MRNQFNEIMQKLRAQRVRARRYTAMLLVLAMLTSLSVSWRLHQVGTALTTDNEYCCGMEEHVHTDDCYTEELVCGYEEGEPEDPDSAFSVDSEPTTEEPEAEPEELEPEETEPEVHHHTADCYETVLVEHEELTCGEEEHTHDETCPVDPDTGDFLCGFEEHTHTDDCFTTETETEEKLVCGYEEGEVLSDGTAADDDGIAALEDTNTATSVAEDSSSEAVSEPVLHHHTEACYEKVLTCTIPEHTHTLACLADYSADVETDDDWEKYSVGLSDHWNEALLAVAQEQLGYKESEKNFQTDEALGDIIDVHHYTRYGAFYGNPYADWDVAFIAFCQHYAGIPKTEIPQRLGLEALRADMDAMGFAYLTEGEEAAYEAIPGDVVTYNKNGTADDETIGIVETVGDDSLTVISGAVEGAVAEVTVPFTDVTSTILVDQAYGDYVGEADDRDGSHDDEIAVQPADQMDATAVDASEDAEVEQLDWKYVTAKVGTGEIRYDKVKDAYTTSLELTLKIPHGDIMPGKTYVLNFPDGVTVPDDECNTDFRKMRESDDNEAPQTGLYRFVKDPVTGKYLVQIKVDKTYYDNHPEGIFEGTLKFKGTMKSSGKDEEGNIIIGGSDGFKIKLDGNKIKYDDTTETEDYSLTVRKARDPNVEGDKLKFTVTVTSKKGTPGVVKFKDVIKVDGLNLGTPTVVIQEREVTEYRADKNSTNWCGTTPGEWSDVQTPSDYQYDSGSGTMSMTLPKMETTTEDTKRIYKEYQIAYVYDISGMDAKKYTGDNTAEVSSTGDKTVSNSDKIDITIDNQYSVSKNGTYQDGKINWTIRVNENNLNIADATLTDSMKIGDKTIANVLAGAQDIQISPAEGWEYKFDENGTKKIHFIGLNDTEENTNSYTITYSTSADGYAGSMVQNTAHFQPSSGTGVDGSNSVQVPSFSVDKKADEANVTVVDGKVIIPWKISVDFGAGKTIPKGMTFEDKVQFVGWGHPRNEQWMTRAQVNTWNGKFDWTNSNGTTVGTRAAFTDAGLFKDLLFYTNQEYTATKTLDQLDDTDRIYGFKVTAAKEITVPEGATKLAFTYTMTGETTGTKRDSYFRNSFWAGKATNSYDYRYKGASIVKKDGNGGTGTTSADNSKDELTWTIDVTTDGYTEHTKIGIKEKLPKGVEFISASVKLARGTVIEVTPDANTEVKDAANGDTFTVSYNSTDDVWILELSNPSGKLPMNTTHTFTVKVKVVKAPDGSELEENKDNLYENSAEAYFENNVSIGSDKQEQHWTKITPTTPEAKIVSKSGEWNATEKELNYTVAINPDGKMLIRDDLEVLKLEDKLTVPKTISAITVKNNPKNVVVDKNKIEISATLQTASVELYYAEKQTDGTLKENGKVYGWKLSTEKKEDGTNNEHSMTISDIPNGQPLILKYTYRITHNAHQLYPDVEFASYQLWGVSNYAELSGTKYNDKHNDDSNQWEESDSDFSFGAQKRLTVIKIEKGNNKQTLGGAKFKLQVWDSSTQTYKDVSDAPVYETADNGQFSISKTGGTGGYAFTEDVLYRLIETEAPEGYNNPAPDEAEAQAVYFYFGTAEAESKLSGAKGYDKAIDVNKGSKTVRVENTPNQTTIAVHKIWKDSTGTDTATTVNDITVQLYQVAYNQKPNESGTAVAIGNIHYFNQENNIWKEISECHPAGTVLTFAITTAENQKEPTLYWNGTLVTPKKSANTDWVSDGGTPCTAGWTYTYVVEMQRGVNTVSGSVKTWNAGNDNKWDAPTASEPQALTELWHGVYGEPVTLNKSNNWQAVFEKLPLFETKADTNQKVYYAYYALETKMDSTEVNENGGTCGDWTVTQGKTPITSGTITIVNTKKPDTPDAPGYELPATGSTGTAPYTTAGVVLMGAALVGGYRRKRRQERRGE